VPPLDLPFALWGRPVKPFAFALMLTMFTVGWLALYGDGSVVGRDVWSRLVGAGCIVAGGFLGGAWVLRRQRAEELGLLASGTAWLFVLLLFAFNTHPSADRFAFSSAWVVAAFGSYWLERSDPVNPMESVARGVHPRHQ
jgi:hypothetical protein